MEEAYEEVEVELTAAFQPYLKKQAQMENKPRAKRVLIVSDTVNNAVWLRIPKNSGVRILINSRNLINSPLCVSYLPTL